MRVSSDQAVSVSRWDPQSVLTVVTGGVLLLVSGTTLWASLGLGFWTPLGPGPGFFPFWLGVLIFVCSLGWLIQDARERRSTTNPPDNAAMSDVVGDEPEVDESFDARVAAAIVASLVALAALMEVLGYQLSMLLFLFFHLKMLGHRGWLFSIALSVAGGVGVFVTFTRFLGVYLPASSIEFLAALGF